MTTEETDKNRKIHIVHSNITTLKSMRIAGWIKFGQSLVIWAVWTSVTLTILFTLYLTASLIFANDEISLEQLRVLPFLTFTLGLGVAFRLLKCFEYRDMTFSPNGVVIRMSSGDVAIPSSAVWQISIQPISAPYDQYVVVDLQPNLRNWRYILNPLTVTARSTRDELIEALIELGYSESVIQFDGEATA